MTLKMFFGRAPLEACARVVANLGEKGFKGKDLEACCEMVAADSTLSAVASTTLVHLVAAAKSSSIIVDKAFCAVCSAASSKLTSNSWPPVDLARLLRALAAAKDSGAPGTDSSKLFSE